MARTNIVKTVALTAGTTSPYNVLLKSDVLIYNFTGTFSLSGNLNIAASGTAKEGMVCILSFAGAITVGANSLTVFGTVVPAKIAEQPFVVVATYVSGAWLNKVIINFGADAVIPHSALGADVYDNTTIEKNATVGLRVKDAGITAAKLATDAVETAKIKAANVTLAKLVDVTRGSLIVGGASNRPVELDVKTSAQILVGDGTDLVSVPLTGDIAVTAGGVTTINASAVGTTKIANDAVTKAKIPAAAGIELTKLAALTATIVPITDGSGFFTSSATTPAELALIHSVTPGVASANKFLLLGASKDIDELNVATTFKIGGTTVTKTADQINNGTGAVSKYDADSNLVEASDVHIVDTAAGDIYITLPLLSAAKVKTHTFKKSSALNTLYILRSGSDTINSKTLADVTSISVTGGTYFTKITMSTTQWDEIAV